MNGSVSELLYCTEATLGGGLESVIEGRLNRMGAVAMSVDATQTLTLLRLIELTPSLKERSDGDELEI